MSKTLIYRCPRCNGLFEASDYGEHGAICKWCGNEVGTEETVEMGDEKQMLTDILNNREELDSVTSIPTGKISIPYIALHCLPFLYLIYYRIVGEPVGWEMYVLIGYCLFQFFGLYFLQKESRTHYKKLKDLIISHNYSLESLSSEIAISKGWGKSVEAAREKQQQTAGSKEVYQCSNCKALFEQPDNHGDMVVCPHCGQETDESGRVQISDDRKAIIDILNDREELSNNLGIENSSVYAKILVFAPLLPWLWFIHHLFSGDPIRWYLVLFMFLGLLVSLFMYRVIIVSGNNAYEKLKSIAEKHDYSILGISTEIAAYQEKADKENEEDDDDEEDDEVVAFVTHYLEAGYPMFIIKVMLIFRESGTVDAEEMVEYLEKLVEYVLKSTHLNRAYLGEDGEVYQNYTEKLVNYIWAKSIVREEYAQSEREGISAETDKADTPFRYLVPPSRCPGCNHAYTKQELDNSTVICPHCATEIYIVDKAVSSQVQQEVKEFLLAARKSEGSRLSKKSLYIWGAVGIICIIFMLSKGVLNFFCSPLAIVWYLVCINIFVFIQSNMSFIELYRMSKEKIYDLTELELMIRTRVSFLMDDFNKFKSELVKQLKK